MFFNACGADQNPLPRLELALAEGYGRMLSDAVDEALAGPMESVPCDLSTAFEFVDLDYDEDSRAETDMNVVMVEGGGLVEIQGTAERNPFDRKQLDRMLDLSAHWRAIRWIGY